MYLKKAMQYESESNLPKCFRPVYEPSSKWQSINYNGTKYFYNFMSTLNLGDFNQIDFSVKY